MHLLYWGLAWFATSVVVALPTGTLLARVSAAYPEAAHARARPRY